jgi:hypothetical protein
MTVCPFCGLATESPHERQAACIEALQEEISRVREIVERMKDATPPTPPRLRTSAPPRTPKHQTNH